MNNARNLSDGDLMSQIKTMAHEERKLTVQVLELLREVDRRRLFARLGYGSIFEYTVKELGFSESSAARRVNSMRLIRDLPDAAASIESGTLNLSNVSTVQSFLKREEREKGKRYSVQEKRELLQKMESRSSRECEKILFQISPESARPQEKARVISAHETELRFVASDELMAKIEQLKGLLGHSHPNISLARLVELLADRALDQLDPVRKAEKAEASKIKKKDQPETPASAPKPPQIPIQNPGQKSRKSDSSVRFIPAAVKRQVWVRAGGQCSYISPETGRRCESKHRLQVDHMQPIAHGGCSDADNVILMCAVHNQHKAIDQLGFEKMAEFIPGLRRGLR